MRSRFIKTIVSLILKKYTNSRYLSFERRIIRLKIDRLIIQGRGLNSKSKTIFLLEKYILRSTILKLNAKSLVERERK